MRIYFNRPHSLLDSSQYLWVQTIVCSVGRQCNTCFFIIFNSWYLMEIIKSTKWFITTHYDAVKLWEQSFVVNQHFQASVLIILLVNDTRNTDPVCWLRKRLLLEVTAGSLTFSRYDDTMSSIKNVSRWKRLKSQKHLKTRRLSFAKVRVDLIRHQLYRQMHRVLVCRMLHGACIWKNAEGSIAALYSIHKLAFAVICFYPPHSRARVLERIGTFCFLCFFPSSFWSSSATFSFSAFISTHFRISVVCFTWASVPHLPILIWQSLWLFSVLHKICLCVASRVRASFSSAKT